jgi:hypothetical protein
MRIRSDKSSMVMEGGSPENQAARWRNDRNFQVGRVPRVQEWPLNMTYTKLWENSIYSQSLSGFKSKYLWFFSARRVSRDRGGDVSPTLITRGVGSGRDMRMKLGQT